MLLACLYVVQGMPYGFQVGALSMYLREHGTSLQAIGFVGLLALPWSWKALWAPLVDRFGSDRFGRRKSWIVPCQLLLMLAAGAAAVAAEADALMPLLGLVFVMNLIAATQDIAVDGLAISLLGKSDLGPGNAAQVVGYKVGMLLSGGLLVALNEVIGWSGLFVAMALLCGLVALMVVAYREEPAPTAAATPGERVRMRDVLRQLKTALLVPGTVWLLVFCGTYKLGESMVDAMFKPFLLDSGFTAATIGRWSGTYGKVASILGSLAGGALAWRMDLLRAVGLTAALRALPLVGVLALALAPPTGDKVISVICAEHFFGGALTTAMFAYLMSRVEPRVGASHYTLLASVEVLGKAPAAWASGFLAASAGYPTVFATGLALSVAYLGLLVPLQRVGAPAAPIARPG